MERSGLISLVNEVIREYYEFGNTPELGGLFTDDVIAFGITSKYYTQGREQVLDFLAENRQKIKSAHVTHLA